MTYDCFSFFNELDLLEIRLNVLDEVVDKFVLVEADRTHSNKPKPMYYRDNEERFARFRDKIIYVPVTDYPPFTSTWAYENHQRNMILKGLEGCAADDVVIISDLDEIPDPKVIVRYPGRGIYKLEQDSYSCFLNYRAIIGRHWHGSKIMTWGDIAGGAVESYQYEYSQFLIEDLNRGSTPTKIRLAGGLPILKRGGWHFTYLGGVEKIKYKLESFAHQEFNKDEYVSDEEIKKKLAKGIDFFNPKDNRCRPVRLDSSFPAYLRDNADRYAHLIYPCEGITRIRSRLIQLKTLAWFWLIRKPYTSLRKIAKAVLHA